MKWNDPIELSKRIGGKIEMNSKKKLDSKNLAVLYTPGVAKVSTAIAKNEKLADEYTIRKNSVAVISDGSAVLGLGNIGPKAALPVMEGKALLFKELGGVDAFPVVLDTQNTKEIISTIKNIAPTFGGINIEDISAPRCFEIENQLIKDLDIPVFHDDQHGTAIVVLAGLINALIVVEKKIEKVKIVIAGAGAAGIAIAKLLISYGAKNVILTDSKGIIYSARREGMNWAKKDMSKITNKQELRGSLSEALIDADVFIGVSAPKIVKKGDVEKMKEKAIVFAMSNPIPEIMPEEAKKAGALIVATGRSDFPNQINNVLAFPGIFRGALDSKIKKITEKHKILAAKKLAALVKKPTSIKIVPSALNKKAVKEVASIF